MKDTSMKHTSVNLKPANLKPLACAVAAFSAAASCSAWGAEQLDTVMVSASRVTESVASIPYTTQIVSGDAIAEHQWLLRQDPYRVDSYQALYRLYFDARAYDKAWCLAATLTFL
ncbi:MAG: hypothetical protein ACPGZU_06025, partial [Ketobacter sp.]